MPSASVSELLAVKTLPSSAVPLMLTAPAGASLTFATAAVAVRVLTAAITPEGATTLTLAVANDSSVVVARLAAAEQLVLVGDAPTAAVEDPS